MEGMRYLALCLLLAVPGIQAGKDLRIRPDMEVLRHRAAQAAKRARETAARERAFLEKVRRMNAAEDARYREEKRRDAERPRDAGSGHR